MSLRTKKLLWLIIPLLILISIQFFSHTGLCFSEARYLSERELVDRYLFGENVSNASEKDKNELLHARYGDARTGERIEGYPWCCRVTGQIQRASTLDRLLNNSFGFFLYEIEILKVRYGIALSNGEFYRSYVHVDACGKRAPNSFGEPLTEGDYHSKFKKNISYWRDQNYD